MIQEFFPQVQNFLETHPDADIKVVLWSEDFVETKIDLIREYCGEQMKIQDYYRVDLKTNSINLTLWLDTKDQTVLSNGMKERRSSSVTSSNSVNVTLTGGEQSLIILYFPVLSMFFNAPTFTWNEYPATGSWTIKGQEI